MTRRLVAAATTAAACAALIKEATAFVPFGNPSFGTGTGADIAAAAVGGKQGSSCRAGGSAFARATAARVARRAPMRQARRGASLGMMFDTLAENMSSVANLFTGQKTITESR